MDAVWPGVVAIALILVPGGVIGYVLGLRRIALVGLAPIFSLTVLGLVPMACAPLHVRWGIVPALVGTLVFALIAWVVRRLLERRWPGILAADSARSLTRWGLVGSAVAFIGIGWRLIYSIGIPSNISQTYDAVFHLSAIRYILDSGIASSMSLSGLPPTGIENAGFYPAGWHDFASLVAMVSGASIPVTVSAVTVVIGAVVWPLSLMFLTRVLCGPRRLPLVVAGVIGGGFAAFPYMMMDYGVLYAFMLGLAVMPALWALAIIALGFAPKAGMSRGASVVALIVALPGISLAHPSATFAVVVTCGPMVLLGLIAWHRRLRATAAPRSRFVALYAGALGLIAVVALVFYKTQPGNFWKPRSTWLEGVIDLVGDSPVGLGPAVAISLMVTTGLAVCILRRERLWLVITWVLFGVLFVVAAAAPAGFLRAALIGMWYGDVYRMAALLAIVEVPLAIIGLTWWIDFLRRHIRVLRSRRAAIASAVVLLLLAALAIQSSNLGVETQRGRDNYAMTPQSKLLTPDEQTLLDQVDDIVPVGVKTIGNPWTGASLVYALANRVPLLSRPGVRDTSIAAITQHLQDAATDPAVCAAVKEHNLGYVLDFGSQEVHGEHHLYPGITNMAANPSVTLAAQVGEASLWKITACSL